MKITKITPQIAALCLGHKCDVEWLHPYNRPNAVKIITDGYVYKMYRGVVTITPHLRRLDSITEEECKDAFKLVHGREWALNVDEYTCKARWWKTVSINKVINCSDEILGRPNTWLYLLSRGFDIFGLIDAGLAKEITT